MDTPSGMELSASLEDYLEVILHIVREKQFARAKDIGTRLNVRRSSVTGALHALASRQLINHAPYDVVTLTEKGRSVAEDVARRHEVLRDFFVRVLAVPEEEANAVACKMEHAVSEAILERFVEFVEFVERCPRGGTKWIKGFGYYCENHDTSENCEKCVQSVLDDVRSKKENRVTPGQTATTLNNLCPGDKASILEVAGEGGIRRRLLDMGATVGTLVEVERVAPLGDPIEVRIRGYHLSLRKEEAQHISVQPVRR